MSYKIRIIRSCYGNFKWELLNGAGLTIAESPNMFTSKYAVNKMVNKLSNKLQCNVEFFDLEKDFIE
jgi:uncharacterized protein YegP (UPF0339 family)